MPNTHDEILGELSKIVGREHVINSSDKLTNYREDKSPFPPTNPKIVVRPANTSEVAELVRLANSKRVPIIARGGGFSLTGFNQSKTDDDIIIDCRRMNHVLDIDTVNFTVTAECGIIMKDLHEWVAEHGLYVNTVGIPIAYTTLGGVLSGVQGGGYPVTMCIAGTNLNFLLGLEVVLPTGSTIKTNAGGANINLQTSYLRGTNAPDFTGLFIGDGGSFGIKTEATLQIFPQAPTLTGGCWDFKDFSQLWDAILSLTALPTLPYENIAILEAKPMSLFYLTRADTEREGAAMASVIDELCKESGGIRASDEMQRYAIDIGVGDPDYQDIFVNVTRGLVAFMTNKREFPQVYHQIREYLDREIIENSLDDIGISLMVYFSPVMRNAIYATMSIIYDEDESGSREACLNLQKRAYEKVVALGASPEPHQGFAASANTLGWSEPLRSFTKDLKRTLDPNDILNRGLWGL